MPPRKKTKNALTFDGHVGLVVDSKRIKREMTVEELADAAGIGYTTLRRRLAGAAFTVLELERVAVAVRTPASEIVEEALRDYGGMEKLLTDTRVEGSMSDAGSTVNTVKPIDPADNVTYIGRVKAPIHAAADTEPRTPPKD